MCPGQKGQQVVFRTTGKHRIGPDLSFIQFVRPALLRLMGASKVAKPVVNAFLEETISKGPSDNVRLFKGQFTIKKKKNDEFHVVTTGDQKPSLFQSISETNCLIIIPANVSRVKAGEKIRIQLIDHDEI